MHTTIITTALSTVLVTAAVAPAQIHVRDKIVALPPISICQDGATHQTVVTGHRLRPGKLNLAPFVGQPVDIQGTPGAVTCKFVDVTAITVLPSDQFTTASSSTVSVKVDFFGVGASGDVYFAYVGGLAGTPLFLPGITGPIHIDPNLFIPLGARVPLGSATPYLTLTAPRTPAVLNIDFFDQAVVVHTGGAVEMTNVDKFRFQ